VVVCRRRVLAGFMVLLASAQGLAQDATLSASVDRDSIHANESFTYILRAEGQLSGRPDLSVLGRDFDVIDTSQSTRIQIVNGRSSQVAEWVVELMPRAPGSYDLPSIRLGALQSNAVPLDILPAVNDSGADGDIFIEVELDRPSAYVQSQVVYTLRLFVGIGTGRATLTAPRVDGGEAIVEKLGGDREYTTVRSGRVYNVRERTYAIFPQTSGQVRIGPAVYDAVIYPSRGFQRQQRLSSDVLELNVNPAVAPPASNPGAVWLPANSLSIEESWSDSPTRFEQGIPQTRVLTVVASGLLETQLPELDPGVTPGLRQYPDQPELSRETTATGIQATRTERYAVIAQQAGPVELPPVELPWFNVDTGRWEIARIEGRTIDVLPGAQSEPPPEATTSAATPPAAATPGPGVWPWVSAGLAIGWLATLAAWAISRRRHGGRAAAPAADRPPSERALIRQIGAACRVDDARRVQDLLLEWARLRFDDPPVSLGALAARLQGQLGTEIAGLEAALYGPRASDWRGQGLFEALKASRSVRRPAGNQDDDPLMPLYR